MLGIFLLAGLALLLGYFFGAPVGLGLFCALALALAAWIWFTAARAQRLANAAAAQAAAAEAAAKTAAESARSEAEAVKAAAKETIAAAQTEAEAAKEAAAAAQERLLVSERQRGEDERRLKMLIQLSHALAEAQDEKVLMDEALSAVTGLVGALGCSFVPVDEWDQPLPPFTFGQLPEPVLRAWAAHLTGPLLRDRCGKCKILVGPPGECPLHPAEVGDAMRVFCIPVTRSESNPAGQSVPIPVNSRALPARPGAAQRTLGVLHLYLAPGRVLDAEMRGFLDGLLQEIFLAYESIRLRSQEIFTLRQLQMLHAPETDFISSLSVMLDGLKQALDAECVMIRLRPSADTRLSNLNVLSGEVCGMEEDEIEAIFTRVVAGSVSSSAKVTALNGGDARSKNMPQIMYASDPGALPVWVALPLVLPDSSQRLSMMPAGHVLGMMMVGVNHPHEFHPRQLAILQTVAAQAALLLENERLMRSLEYKVVIQERARLAREIHDGLAQTLAYLKLQSAQMQSYLAQGDTARLGQVLKDNYQALAEAYLDTRQAIDNLRLTPQEGLHTWLERILREFENSSGLRVDRRFKHVQRAISPEIQAQLIRIVQESLSNVRKHARAHTVRFDLREWKSDLVLEISDDGLGFDTGDIPEISRHGLRGMRERAEMIGADFQIISKPQEGTTVRLVLPAFLEEEPTS